MILLTTFALIRHWNILVFLASLRLHMAFTAVRFTICSAHWRINLSTDKVASTWKHPSLHITLQTFSSTSCSKTYQHKKQMNFYSNEGWVSLRVDVCNFINLSNCFSSVPSWLLLSAQVDIPDCCRRDITTRYLISYICLTFWNGWIQVMAKNAPQILNNASLDPKMWYNVSQKGYGQLAKPF